MKYYEEAIRRYEKAEKDYCEQNIKTHKTLIKQLKTDGKCRSLECKFCPVRLYFGAEWQKTPCTNLSFEEIKRIANAEV